MLVGFFLVLYKRRVSSCPFLFCLPWLYIAQQIIHPTVRQERKKQYPPVNLLQKNQKKKKNLLPTLENGHQKGPPRCSPGQQRSSRGPCCRGRPSRQLRNTLVSLTLLPPGPQGMNESQPTRETDHKPSRNIAASAAEQAGQERHAVPPGRSVRTRTTTTRSVFPAQGAAL